MALRSLDNDLSMTPERPKKIAKIVGNARTPVLGFGVNDENSTPTAKVDPAPDYIASKDLMALADPEATINGLLEGLNAKDWMKSCDTLNCTRRLALHHSSLLFPILDKVILMMVKAIKNPRSSLCKTSILASSDIFCAFGHVLLTSSSSEAFEHLLVQLLLKASQDKKFVCEEADRALEAMTKSVPPLLLLHKLRSFVTHSNLKLRAKAAVCISSCISKMDIEAMEQFGFVPLIRIAADLLNDRLPEAREAARGIANSVYKAFTGKDEQQRAMEGGLSSLESWQNLCSSELPPMSAQAMIKIVPH